MPKQKEKIKFIEKAKAATKIDGDFFEHCAEVLAKANIDVPADMQSSNIRYQISQKKVEIFHKIEGNLHDGHTVVLTLNGHAASSCSFRKMRAQFYDGRDVYEIVSVVTLPEFQHHGLFKKTFEHTFDRIRQEFPTAPITATSKNPAVKAELAHWHMGDADKKLQILIPDEKFTDQYLKARRKEWKDFNWNFFWFDPLES